MRTVARIVGLRAVFDPGLFGDASESEARIEAVEDFRACPIAHLVQPRFFGRFAGRQDSVGRPRFSRLHS